MEQQPCNINIGELPTAIRYRMNAIASRALREAGVLIGSSDDRSPVELLNNLPPHDATDTARCDILALYGEHANLPAAHDTITEHTV